MELVGGYIHTGFESSCGLYSGLPAGPKLNSHNRISEDEDGDDSEL